MFFQRKFIIKLTFLSVLAFNASIRADLNRAGEIKMIEHSSKFNKFKETVSEIKSVVKSKLPITKELLGKTATLVMFFYSSILAHELGHAVTSKVLGGGCNEMSIYLLGDRGAFGRAFHNKIDSKFSEILVLLAGPLTGAAFCAAVSKFYGKKIKEKEEAFSVIMQLFAYMMCASNLANLLPVTMAEPTDPSKEFDLFQIRKNSDGYKIFSNLGVQDKFWEKPTVQALTAIIGLYSSIMVAAGLSLDKETLEKYFNIQKDSQNGVKENSESESKKEVIEENK